MSSTGLECGSVQNFRKRDTAPHPRNFAITPNGRFLLLASRDGNVIEIYSIDPETGALTPTDKSISTSKPVCLKFFPRS